MIFDIGWVELLVIAVVAIVVVGPKDLPRLMRIVGQWIGKARGLAREFQHSFDEMIRESELDELRKEVEELRKINPMEQVKSALDPNDELKTLEGDLSGEMLPLEDPDLGAEQDAQDKARKVSGSDEGGAPAP